MSNIKLDLTATPFDGQIVTFTAPCACSDVSDGLIINDETYTVCDAMGNCVTGVGGAWCEGAQVSVVLDCTNKKAYIQNAATASGGYTETDPTVPDWAKAETKPTYTYDEVGAAPAPLSASVTLYVATTGSDTAGDGSSANPYATIQYALDTIPKDLGTYYVTINVAAGEYAGFTVTSFINGYQNKPGINIVGESRDTVTITGPVMVNSCSAYISLQALHFTGLVSCLSNRYLYMTGCLIDGTDATQGLRIDVTNTVKVFNTIINDKTGYAIQVDGSMAFINYVSGENNTVGVQSGNNASATPGLVIIGNSFTLSATTQYVKLRGGIIIQGDAFV